MKAEAVQSILTVVKIPWNIVSICLQTRNLLVTVPKTPIHIIADLWFLLRSITVYMIGVRHGECWISEPGDLGFVKANSLIDCLALAADHDWSLRVDLLSKRWCHSCLFCSAFFGTRAGFNQKETENANDNQKDNSIGVIFFWLLCIVSFSLIFLMFGLSSCLFQTLFFHLVFVFPAAMSVLVACRMPVFLSSAEYTSI